jgi:serine/threonine protein kinase
MVQRYSFRKFKKKTSDAGNDARNAGQGVRRSSRQAGQSNQQSIQEAQEAASLGGTFTIVECAFERCRFIPSCNMSSNNSKSDDVTTSPFYFKGRMISSKTPSTTKDVFLKVWNAEHVGVLPVEMEWTHYKIALNAGVPVAAPVLPEIVLATSSSGLNHLVFAVEYIHEDAIQTIEDIVRFSESLIKSVVKSHDAAGLLHCDLKPANVRWSNGVVNLIDFGHAQPINLAVWVY